MGWTGIKNSFFHYNRLTVLFFFFQTLGSPLTVDGRFRGTLNVTSITCDTSANTCSIPVPAPGFALVFLSSPDPDLNLGQATKTFSTTAYTKNHNTATIDSAVLATSNGHSGAGRAVLGSTSRSIKDGKLLWSGSEGGRGMIPRVMMSAMLGLLVGWLVAVVAAA